MIKRILTVIIVVIAVILCFKYWKYIWPVIAGIIGLLFISQGKLSDREKQAEEIQEKEKELDRDAEDRRKKAEALAKEDEEQKEKVEDWRERKNRWKSRGSMMLVLCMLLVAATPAWAGEEFYADLTREELIERLIAAEKLLDEADQLLARETSLKEEYKRLYLKAEEDCRAARELSAQKDEIIAAWKREIEVLQYRLKRSARAWGLTGGVTLTGNDAQWSVGVARKKGWLSFGAGIGGGDRFSVWGSVTLWLQNP